MSGLARPPKQTGGQKRNVRFVGPGMLSPAGRSRDIELASNAANYTGEPEFCPR